MKRVSLFSAVLFLILLLAFLLKPALFQRSSPQHHLPAWEVYFSPHGGCTEAIVRELDKAKTGVFVQAYSFTSKPIAEALRSAHKRGVNVEVILDKSQRSERYSSADFLAHSGIKTYIDPAHAIAHNKVMIIDSDVVITGSFNFTRAAEDQNAENVLILRDAALADTYKKNWTEHMRHSEIYTGEAAPEEPVKKEPKQKPPKQRPPKQRLSVKPGDDSPGMNYYSAVWGIIKQKWDLSGIPSSDTKNLEAVIIVKIGRDGELKSAAFEKRSGNAIYDQKAMEAVKKSEPFPTFPKEMKGDTLEIGLRFFPE